MIRAYLKGQKTQTRRLKGLEEINGDPDEWEFVSIDYAECRAYFHNLLDKKLHYTCRLPYGDTLDTLWFKECYRAWEDQKTGEDFLLYRADGGKFQPFASNDPSWNLLVGKFNKWNSSMFMPQWASRFWNVPILSVRVERLQDITGSDCYFEGVGKTYNGEDSFYSWQKNQRALYFDLWDTINGKSLPWKKNPWVFVYEFPVYDPEQVSKIHQHQEEK